MRLSIGIVFSFFFVWAQAQIPLVGSGRQVYSPDQVDSLFYWFDAQDLTTITTTNNKVTAWADKGPFGYDVVQADTSKAPTYSATAGPNGNTAAMVFDGTDDFLASSAHWWGSDDITVFAIVKFNSATRDVAEFIVAKNISSTSNDRQWQFYGHNAANNYSITVLTDNDGASSASAALYNGPKSSTYKILGFTSNGTLGSIYDNGVSKIKGSTQTIYNSSTPKLGIGCNNAGGTENLFLQGSISEIIVFSRALTNAERQGIEAYLSSKYDLALQNKQKQPVISNRRIQPDYVDSLFYWFDAMDASSLLDSVGGAVSNNEGVATWADKSGRNYDVTQSTNGARPLYKATGGPGGNTPALQFDGTDDFLASAAHWWGSDDLTVFVVMKWGNATRDALEYAIAKNEGSGNLRQWAFQSANVSESYTLSLDVFSDGTTNRQTNKGSAKSTLWRVIAWTDDSSGNTTLFIDGSNTSITQSTTGGDGTIYDTNLTKLSVGATNVTSTPAAFLQGSISEIIVYSSALSDSERVGVEQYLKQKWGL